MDPKGQKCSQVRGRAKSRDWVFFQFFSFLSLYHLPNINSGSPSCLRWVEAAVGSGYL